MNHTDYADDHLSESCEDAFVNIKEACLRLQERTKCNNKVVIDLLNNVVEYYVQQDNI